MRSIEEIAAEEETRIREERLIRLRGFALVAAFGFGIGGWWVFHAGLMDRGAACVVASFLFFFMAFDGLRTVKTPARALAGGLLASVPPFLLYHFTRAPLFGWGKDPSFWLSVHAGAVGEPFWSPLSYLLAQACCFIFPKWKFTFLPELSAGLMALAVYFLFQEYFRRFKNKTNVTLASAILVCWVLSFSLPFWNAATLGSGIVGGLGLLLFLVYRSFLSIGNGIKPGQFFLTALLYSVHPLWGLLATLQYFEVVHKNRMGWEVIKNNLWCFGIGLTPYLWIVFRAREFFPNWGGKYPFSVMFHEWSSLWKNHVTLDWDWAGALSAHGWTLGLVVFLAVFLWFLHFSNWRHQEKPVFSAFEFWVLITACVGGFFFYSESSKSLGPTSLWFAGGLGGMILRLAEKRLERRSEKILSGPALWGGAGAVLSLALGLAFLPSQSCFRESLYFPEEHALNLLQALGEKSILVCDDSFEANACLETRLMESTGLSALIFERRRLGRKWFVEECIENFPELLFSGITGTEDDLWKSLILDNRDHWDIHWDLSALPPGWIGPPAVPTVLTQEFPPESGTGNLGNAQYRYDLTVLPMDKRTRDFDSQKYFFRYVLGFVELGKAFRDQGRYSAAIHAFERSVKLDPSFGPPQELLSDMYSKQNILEAARLEFEKTVREDPGKINTVMGEIDDARKAKDDAKTVELLDQVIHLNSELADVQFQLSKIYEKEGRPTDAKALLESSVQLNPRQVEAQLTLGKMMASLGNRIKSEEAFRSVLTLDPQNKEAQLELWKLLNRN